MYNTKPNLDSPRKLAEEEGGTTVVDGYCLFKFTHVSENRLLKTLRVIRSLRWS